MKLFVSEAALDNLIKRNQEIGESDPTPDEVKFLTVTQAVGNTALANGPKNLDTKSND